MVKMQPAVENLARPHGTKRPRTPRGKAKVFVLSPELFAAVVRVAGERGVSIDKCRYVSNTCVVVP